MHFTFVCITEGASFLQIRLVFFCNPPAPTLGTEARGERKRREKIK
jgi:hypothetical protein